MKRRESVIDLKNDLTLLKKLLELASHACFVSHELFMFQDIMYSSLFDFSLDKVRRDVKKSNSRKRVEN